MFSTIKMDFNKPHPGRLTEKNLHAHISKVIEIKLTPATAHTKIRKQEHDDGR